MTNLFKNQIIKEIVITLLVLAIYRLMLMIPLPFLNLSQYKAIFESYGSLISDNNFFSNISIAALGIMPFISAFLIVEIFSLFIPFLTKHRKGDYKGRKILLKYSMVLTLFFSVIQGYAIIRGLENLLSPSGIPILFLSNKLQFFCILVTLIAAVFFLLYLAEIVTNHGIGNGISLLILSGISFKMSSDIIDFFTLANKIQLGFFPVIKFLIIALFLFLFIPIILLKASYTIPLKHNSDESSVSFFKLSSCLSGNVAIGYATSLLMLPFTLSQFTESFESIVARSLNPGTFGYYFTAFILVLLLSYFFAWLFLHPKRRFETLKSWGWGLQKANQPIINFIKLKLLIINLPWSFILFGVVILPSIIASSFNAPFYFSGSSLLVIAFLSLDIVSRFNLWKDNVHEKTFKIAEFHDLHFATMIKNHLKKENIKFYMQGYYHRHLLFFFGPYIPINLMIPSFEKNRVSEIITRYYGGLGLIEKKN